MKEENTIMTKKKLMQIIDCALHSSPEEKVVDKIKEFFRGAQISDDEEIKGLDSVNEFIKNGGYKRAYHLDPSIPSTCSDLEKILAQLHTFNDNRTSSSGTESNNKPQTTKQVQKTEANSTEGGNNEQPVKNKKKHLLYWIIVVVAVVIALSSLLLLNPNLPHWLEIVLWIFSPSGMVYFLIFGLVLPLREYNSDIRNDATPIDQQKCQKETKENIYFKQIFNGPTEVNNNVNKNREDD